MDSHSDRIFSLYQTAVNLYNVKNNIPNNHLQEVNSVTMTDRRNLRQTFIRNNRYHIGLNIVKKRLRSITNVIDKMWMDKIFKDFKLCCKHRIIQDLLEYCRLHFQTITFKTDLRIMIPPGRISDRVIVYSGCTTRSLKFQMPPQLLISRWAERFMKLFRNQGQNVL